jgi:hypothetical protein
MTTTEAETGGDEGVRAADGRERLCFKLEEGDDDGFQIGKDGR